MIAQGLQAHAAEPTCKQTASGGPIILSFDVEEHRRNHVDVMTHSLLDRLAERRVRATFFVLGQVAEFNPKLVRAIADAGHEVASHGWNHECLLDLTPARFRDDVCRSKNMLEQVTGRSVVGYRAPDFSVVPDTLWALDVLAEEGFRYDSSIYPAYRDGYGIPLAPRTPFYVQGSRHRILELPPATLNLLGVNLPVAGSFRSLPLFLLDWTLYQIRRTGEPPVVMLYFHPREFDTHQQPLPLPILDRFRRYARLTLSAPRLERLLDQYRFACAVDVVNALERLPLEPVYPLAA